jgi:hypothetical protein
VPDPPPAPPKIAAPDPPAPKPAKKSAANQRASRRINMNIRARVRRGDGRTEVVVTLDASRDGLSFHSKQSYALGEPIHVAMHYHDGEEPIETPGCVVRVSSRGAGSEYGVKLGSLQMSLPLA